MSYRDDYPVEIQISDKETSEVQKILINGIMQEGEFKARDALIVALEEAISEYLDGADYSPNMEWVNGVRYAIHVIKDAKLHG